MEKDRLIAFTDGVVAVIITIMVLELKSPHDTGAEALLGLLPVFLGYALSFVYVAIYWLNHHHMFALVRRVDGGILWANLHFLFWLSLIPWATGWIGENHGAPIPAAVYGAALLMPSLGWLMLQRAIVRGQGEGSALARALGRDLKGKASTVLYLVAIAAAFLAPAASEAIYAAVAAMWLVPDRRFAAAAAPDGS